RWNPLIIRELVLGNTRFNDIARGMPGISRSLLVQRLRHLEKKGVLETWPSATGRGSEYHLTPAGRDLERVVDSLGRWAVEWLFDDLRPQDVPPTTLMWWMHRRVDVEALPEQRVVVEFEHTSPDPTRIWMLVGQGEASVCLQPPALDVDVVVQATTPDLAAVFSGSRTWQAAVADGSIAVAGTPALTRGLSRWFLWSPFASAVAARAELAS
ncbi:MAG TPA: winged helix-turn-helix transcriptional regulator, partial [Acidimicrobiales bacterium]|nr:winged helix-turn-helix transcriptional regulator [Acidimicrobiales bacterium]